MPTTTIMSTRGMTLQQSKEALFLLGVICFGIAGWGVYVCTLRPLALVHTARTWVATPCTILHNRVSRSYRSSSFVITYAYVVEGRRYQSSRFRFFPDFSTLGVGQYPRGRQTVCYVDPHDPTQAVLDRGIPLDSFALIPQSALFLVAVFGAGAMALALCVALWGPFRQVGQILEGEGPIVLQSTLTPLQLVILFSFPALLSGGLFAFFLWAFADRAPKDNLSWTSGSVLGLLGPCALCFAFFGGFFVVRMLALFNPRPVLTLSRSHVPLGGSARLNWALTGRTAGVRLLTLLLTGTETLNGSPNYSTSVVDRPNHTTSVFYRKVLVQTSDPEQITAWETEVALPGNTMHSFQAAHNSINWVIQVRAEIPRWPDVVEEFPFLEPIRILRAAIGTRRAF